MRRKVVFDAEARLEFEEAVIWYSGQQPGLGDRFDTEIHATIQRILANPERFREVSKKTRLARVEIFKKYGVYFRIGSDFIGIVSIFHASRNPAELWRRLR
jgi:plasmid stabilization system protein ParE